MDNSFSERHRGALAASPPLDAKSPLHSLRNEGGRRGKQGAADQSLIYSRTRYTAPISSSQMRRQASISSAGMVSTTVIMTSGT